MDKEMNNVMAIQDFFSIKATTKYLSNAISTCNAVMEFNGLGLPAVYKNSTDIIFEHGYNNILKIPCLKQPYYSDFWTTRQSFEFNNNTLTIKGNSPDGKSYTVVLK